jgi:hypothetical protein
MRSTSSSPASLSRRLVMLALVTALVAAPAGVLRAMCVGKSCERVQESDVDIPFCSLSPTLRRAIATGYYDGRSPDIVVVARQAIVGDTTGRAQSAAWPSSTALRETRVPIVFFGRGVDRSGRVPDGAVLHDIAPTVADLVDLERPHPEVRAGQEIAGVSSGEVPRLVLTVVWKGISSSDLEARPAAWPTLRGLMARGVATMEGRVGSLPADPTPVLATIGTGGLPREHGIVAPIIRSNLNYGGLGSGAEVGSLVPAWAGRSPGSVIATLADDLDEAMSQRPRIGLVGTEIGDRGLVGRNWYPGADSDDVAIADNPGLQTEAFVRMVKAGYGRDSIPDLVAVAARGPIKALDGQLRRLIAAAEDASDHSLAVIVTTSGGEARDRRSMPAGRLVQRIEQLVGEDRSPVADAVPAGLFLDPKAMTAGRITDDDIVRSVLDVRAGGERVAVDAFGGLAVSFGRYC